MKKRISVLLLAILMFVTAFPVNAYALDNPVNEQLPLGSGVTATGYYITINDTSYFIPKNTLVYQGMSVPNETVKEYVRIAQRALNNVKTLCSLNYAQLSVDGIFGPASHGATCAFQQWWNDNLIYLYGSTISVDGIVGNDTWRRFVTVCR